MEALFDYTLMGTVREEESVRLYDAVRSGEPQRRYLVSEVALSPQTQELLQQSLDCLRLGGCGKLAAVYAQWGRCYLVFHAPSGAPLHTALAGGLSDALASRRFALLRAIVLALYGARELPYPAVLGSAAPEQIRVGRDGRPRLCFCVTQAALGVPRGEAQRALCRAVAELLRLLFARELAGGGNSALSILAGKCEAGLFPSLPALADALGRVEEAYAVPGWEDWRARVGRRLALRLPRAGRLAVPAAALVLLLVVLALPRDAAEQGPSEPFQIGGVVYIADPLSPGVAALSREAPRSLEGRPRETPAVTGDPALFSDHVVRSGESLDSVCAGYYGDAAYAAAVAAYNGLEAEAPLHAGTILKLPEPLNTQGGPR